MRFLCQIFTRVHSSSGKWKAMIKSLCTARQGREQNPRNRKNPNPKHRAKPSKAHLEKASEVASSPHYRRLTIRKISNILRSSSSWLSAAQQLDAIGVKWDSYTINQVLKTHPPLQMAKEFFNWAKTLPDFKHDQFTYTTMLDILGEARRIDLMKNLMQEMGGQGRRIDSITYTAVMHSLGKAGDVDGALQTWETMKRNECFPTVVSYTAIIKILLKNNRPEEARALYKEMLEANLSPNCYTYTVLIEYLADQGKFEGAFDIFTQMRELNVEPSKATFNILVQKCAKAGRTNIMVEVLKCMKSFRHVLRPSIFFEALEALHKAGEGDQLLLEIHPHLSHEVNQDRGCRLCPKRSDVDQKNLRIDTDILWILLHRRNFTAVESLLEEMSIKGLSLDVRILTAIIRACSANAKLRGALTAYQYGGKLEIQFDLTVYTSLFGILIRHKLHEKVIGIVDEMIQKGVNPGTYILSVLIRKFGCAGLCDAAQKIFDSIPDEQNAVTYTALIDAFISAGSVEKAIEIYETMKRNGVKPATGTYKVLQLCLEKAGRYQEAKVFKQKRLTPRTYFPASISIESRETEEQNLCNVLFDNDSHIYG